MDLEAQIQDQERDPGFWLHEGVMVVSPVPLSQGVDVFRDLLGDVCMVFSCRSWVFEGGEGLLSLVSPFRSGVEVYVMIGHIQRWKKVNKTLPIRKYPHLP